MAGRGRELTLPAWMKRQQEQKSSYHPPSSSRESVYSGPSAHQHQRMPSSLPSQYDNAPEARSGSSITANLPDDRRRDSRRSHRIRSRSPHRRDRSRSKEKRSSRHRSTHERRSRSRENDRHRSRDYMERHSSRRSRSCSRSSPRVVRRRKKSNFDVRPPGVTEENAAAYAAQAILQQNMAALSGSVGPASFGPPQNVMTSTGNSSAQSSYAHASVATAYGLPGMSQQTRHARRLYVGGIGEISEAEITVFFNDVIDRALGEKQEGGSVVSVYINRERHFAFVELRTIELTTACMNLDGVSYNGQPLKIRRPNDYNPGTVPTDLGPIPQLNLAALGIVSTTVSDGPGKIFVGGLPYHLNEEQVKELLQAFGPLRSFHLVKELSSNLSKGYGFCEYMDVNVTDAACLGLNDMRLGDKTLTVRRAMSQENAKAVASAAGTVNTGLELGLDPSQAAMQAMSLAGITSVPLGPPTRVIVLHNMVTPEELEDEEEYADIVDDIKGECERFGAVPSLLLPRPRDGVLSAVGKVYVEFSDVQSAQNAAAELHGRGFSNRTVAVEFMDEGKYARREIT
ncbi:splicing factor u2af large [Plasmopara halstedii]|uniref:Splicing factor U2AF subunit n=1 Tax=Plasmopara halstedii TaxID=4781 RepID=A0A0P1B7G2_PLAHL|nr:splicing factor u2af large [Plasmopara halstedii]CEG50284.1 splicing factor u2af large [Plasmopara halstedii]|eukprot:XP_024586653.1 splicing factor u2af large [Plasmopara halstedii]